MTKNLNLRISTDRAETSGSGGVEEVVDYMMGTPTPSPTCNSPVSTTNDVPAVSHVHSFLRDWKHDKLNPLDVFKTFFGKEEGPPVEFQVQEKEICEVFKIYGMDQADKESVLSELNNLFHFYF